ncbi:MAG: sensor histidine kinase [Actinomycetota bacterium]
MHRMFGSVRVRTTLTATVAVGIAVTFGGIGLVTTLDHSLRTGARNTVEQRMGDLVALSRSGSLTEHLTSAGQPGAVVQVVDASGRVVAESSPSLSRRIGGYRGPGSPPLEWTQRLTSDDELYQIVGTSASSPAGPVTIYAALSLEAASDSVTKLKSELAIGLPLLILVVAVICWVIVGRALRPVEAIRKQVAEIGAVALDRRVPEPRVDDEIGRLARTMNEMLARLQASSERQRHFVADASHELRSPLASLRAQIEVERDYTQGEAQSEVVIADQLAELDRMQRLVSDLLLLARADERKLVSRANVVDLDRIVLEEANRLILPEHVRIDTSRVRPARLRGDPNALARGTRNLLDNAARFARSRIDVALFPSDDRVRLTISDDGPGIPEDARELVFERFRRSDEGRSRSSGGAGLGLAIVREIVVAHGGLVRIEDRGSGACFVILLPSDGAAGGGNTSV